MNQPPTNSGTFRCAIYTRKSTEEGLQQPFNSLDAQREAAQAYLASQRHQGWVAVSERYDDGGFSGGNLERPALKRLLDDIQAGRIDAVLVYKVDRLSRSLLDFARLMETFDHHQVALVAVTQSFNTATSMGRLILNVLLSFAQFERELIAERTRDKIAAARRKGQWAGGHPLLGYDVDPRSFQLVVNDAEAVRVRAIFDLYLDLQSLLAVVRELYRRGWVTKQWLTRKGRTRGGVPFTTTSLHKLLTNVTYLGKIKYKDEAHPGEHVGIVAPDVWQRVQTLLRSHGPAADATARHRSGALLAGLLRCVPCRSAMTHAFCTKDKIKRYRYYVCAKARKRGWGCCPSKSVPATEIERFVIEQIQGLVDHPPAGEEPRPSAPAEAGSATTAAAELQALARTLAPVLPLWDTWTPSDQARLVRALVQRINYDGSQNTVSIAFHPADHPPLTDELARLIPKETVCPTL